MVGYREKGFRACFGTCKFGVEAVVDRSSIGEICGEVCGDLRSLLGSI